MSRNSVFLLAVLLLSGCVSEAPPDEVPPRSETSREQSTFSDSSAVELPKHPRNRSQRLKSVDDMAQKVDANHDDWGVEVFAEAAALRLKRLSDFLADPSDVHRAALLDALDERFVSSRLVPPDLEVVTTSPPFRVWRRAHPDVLLPVDGDGSETFAQELRSTANELGPGGQLRSKLKLYSIERAGDTRFKTLVRFEASNSNDESGRQITGTWICDWNFRNAAAPKLTRVQLQRFERVDIGAEHGRLFVDCTQSALQANDSYEQQTLPSIPDWLATIPSEFMGQFGHHGLAIGDVNGDELDDVYICDAGGLPNQLLVQQPDGTARNVAAASGVDFLENSVAALLIDIDNDGDQDLVVGLESRLLISENNGDGTFRLGRIIDLNTDAFSLSSADFDQDGDLDLYICGYNVRRRDPTDRGLPFPMPYHDANNGGRNLLLANLGDFAFVDVTADVGLDKHNRRFSMAASWEDFDNDGDQDLYVANDFGRNNLFRNDGGQFTDIARVAGVEDHASGMSVSWGDCNRDGWMDLYVGNMFSAAGNRVTFQRRFAEGADNESTTLMRRMARGNTLFINRPQLSPSKLSPAAPLGFEDTSLSAEVNMGRWAWASKFVDLTNDGWLDLVVANGYLTNQNDDDL